MSHSIRAALLDRDPGDESEQFLSDSDIELLRTPEPPIVRSYRATLKKRGEDFSHFFRDVDATSFADAVWTAEHQRGEDEILLNVRAIEDLDEVRRSCA